MSFQPSKLLHRQTLNLLTAVVVALFAMSAQAAVIVETDFDDQTAQGWVGFGVRSPGPTLETPGPSGDPDDYYLQVIDTASTGGIAALQIHAADSYTGSFASLADSCSTLEFDFRMIDDQGSGLPLSVFFDTDPDGPLNGADAEIRARFRVTDPFDESDGWRHVVVPIERRAVDGSLPSNAFGAWEMSLNNDPSEWNALLDSVDVVFIPLDISGISESYGIDNVRLVSGQCPCPTEPNRTQRAGLADDYAAPSDFARRNFLGAVNPPIGWKGFDDARINHWLGHTFVALPTDVIAGQLEIRMRPAGGQFDNDTLNLGHDGTGGFLQTEVIADLGGGSDDTYFVPLAQSVVDKIADDRRLEMVVQDDTTVDYAILHLIQCPPPVTTGGTPFDPRGETSIEPNLFGGQTLAGDLIEFEVTTPGAQGNCVATDETCVGLGQALTLAATGTSKDLNDGSGSIGTLTFTPHPDGVGLTVDFDTSGKSTTKVVEGRGATTVVSDYGDNGLVAVIPPGTCISEVDYIDNGCFRAFFVGQPVDVDLTRSGTMGAGNGVEICPDVIVGDGPRRIDTFTVTGEGFDELRTTGIAVQQFDVFSRALGEASLDTTPDSLVLTNLADGDDGLAIAFDDVDAARLEWAPLRPTDEPTFVEIETRGTVDGTETSLGSLRFEEDGLGYVMQDDLISLTEARTLEILEFGSPVAALDVNSSADVRVSELPTSVAARALDGPLGVAAGFPAGTVVTVDGVDFTGDEIRLSIPDTSGGDTTINECIVRPGGLEEVSVTDVSYGGDDVCVEDAERLCLQQGRYQVEVLWTDFDGNSGRGRAVPLTSDTGYFWFFGEENVELVVKVLDGRPINGNFWVFYGALSSVEYQLRVTDTATGSVRTYLNPSGAVASSGDTSAFTADGWPGERSATPDSSGVPRLEIARQVDTEALGARAESPRAKEGCIATDGALCLNDDRFRIEVEWTDFEGDQGVGTAVPLTSDTGYFWFFGEENVELMIKVLDGRPVNGNFWVFYGALSNVAYRITVTDTMTGDVRVYDNPLGRFGSLADTGAFVP